MSTSTMAYKLNGPVNLSDPDCLKKILDKPDIEKIKDLKLNAEKFIKNVNSLTKGGGNSRSSVIQGCTKDSEKPLREYINRRKLTEHLDNIEVEIQELFPNIKINEHIDNMKICRTQTPLEIYLSAGADKSREIIWMPGWKNQQDYIMYNKMPVAFDDEERNKLAWSLVKEVLHNYVHSDQYVVRDAQLQIIMKTLRGHIETNEVEKSFVKTITQQFGFPKHIEQKDKDR